MSLLILFLLCIFNLIGWILVFYSVYWLCVNNKKHLKSAMIAAGWFVIAILLVAVTIKIATLYSDIDSIQLPSLEHFQAGNS